MKLLDFGIATDTDISPEQRLTRAGFFVGTLMYVAPEALSGELVGPLADQYSLATIAYFLLTGCLPFPAKTPREMFSQLLSQPPIPLNQAKPGLRFSPAVEGVVMRGLSKEPASATPTSIAFAKEFCDASQQPAEQEKTGIRARSSRRCSARRPERGMDPIATTASVPRRRARPATSAPGPSDGRAATR